jgi:hypothetical protein
MLSFKQYLQEGETQNSVYLECTYYFPGTPITDITASKVIEAVSTVIKGFRFSIQDLGLNSFAVVIINPDNNWLKTKKAQTELHHKILKAVCSEYKMNFSRVIKHHWFEATCNIGLNRLLPFQIDCHLLFINAQIDTVFTNIKKLVKCDAIHIYQMEYFGKNGLLGLLQIPHPTKVYVASNGITKSEFPELSAALKILKTHLDGDRNVLACQEELIDNGFKDYAQL